MHNCTYIGLLITFLFVHDTRHTDLVSPPPEFYGAWTLKLHPGFKFRPAANHQHFPYFIPGCSSLLLASSRLSFSFTLRVASHVCVLTQRWTQSHESERDSSICVSLSLSWFCVWRCLKTQSWDATLRVPSHVSGMRCVFARNHESERDTLILLSLLLSWFRAKTQRIRIHGTAPWVFSFHPRENLSIADRQSCR